MTFTVNLGPCACCGSGSGSGSGCDCPTEGSIAGAWDTGTGSCTDCIDMGFMSLLETENCDWVGEQTLCQGGDLVSVAVSWNPINGQFHAQYDFTDTGEIHYNRDTAVTCAAILAGGSWVLDFVSGTNTLCDDIPTTVTVTF